MAQQQVLLDKFGDLGLTVTMKDELFELMDICSQYNLSKYTAECSKILNIQTSDRNYDSFLLIFFQVNKICSTNSRHGS